MMFSQTSEYALRVVLSLASSGDRPLTIPQLSEITSTPPDYLAKVIRGLAKTGLIISQRGAHGGSVLARATEKITVYDVMQAVDPIQRIITCPLKLPNHGTNLCPLHRRLDDAIGMVEDAFRKTSIADLIAEKSESRPLGDRAGGRDHAGISGGRNGVLKGSACRISQAEAVAPSSHDFSIAQVAARVLVVAQKIGDTQHGTDSFSYFGGR